MTIALGRRARAAAHAALGLVLPPHCPTCQAIVDAPGRLCPACFGRTQLIAEPCCCRCGRPFTARTTTTSCADCTREPPPWGEARAALAYDDQARKLILPLKYGDRTDLLRALVPLMARAGAPLLARADVLVPVPLHRLRLLARRYNQSALLARALARHSAAIPVLDGLLRTRRTPRLGPLDPAQREAALDGAIRVNPARRAVLADARVLLVDDVLTSGATARACTEALLEAGAAGVDVLAAARVSGDAAS